MLDQKIVISGIEELLHPATIRQLKECRSLTSLSIRLPPLLGSAAGLELRKSSNLFLQPPASAELRPPPIQLHHFSYLGNLSSLTKLRVDLSNLTLQQQNQFLQYTIPLCRRLVKLALKLTHDTTTIPLPAGVSGEAKLFSIALSEKCCGIKSSCHVKEQPANVRNLRVEFSFSFE